MSKTVMRNAATFAAFLTGICSPAQWSFEVDTTFRTVILDQNVNSIAVLSTDEVLLSGRIRFPGDMSDRALAKVTTGGAQVIGFPYGFGSGKLTPWNGQLYVQNGSLVRRLDATGLWDPSYVGMNSVPYVQSGIAGDYHVFPDGRVLMSGSHTLNDPVRGFVGYYELIWFTNTGYLDTTRTHRNANGPIWEFKELPNGQFICTCSCTQYEGQPVSRVFRVHADGALDDSFQSTITMGNIYEIEGLPDGSVLLGGNFRFNGAPQDTVRFAKLLPDGSRDPGFASLTFAGNGSWWPPSGTIVFDIFPFHGGNYILAGQFTTVGGQPRQGLCMVDGNGQLLGAFDECGVGPFTYQTTTNATPLNIYWNQDSTALYICGAYSGYNDGTTNDTQQRFVSRLLVNELSTDMSEVDTAPSWRLYPNPASTSTTIEVERITANVSVIARDALGRELLRQHLLAHRTTLDLQTLRDGIYSIHLFAGPEAVGVQRLVVQH